MLQITAKCTCNHEFLLFQGISFSIGFSRDRKCSGVLYYALKKKELCRELIENINYSHHSLVEGGSKFDKSDRRN